MCAPTSTSEDIALKIKRDLKTFACQWDSVNSQLKRLGKPSAENHLLIALRQSITYKIDEQRNSGLPLDTGLVQDMYRAVSNINAGLMQLRYDLT